MLDFYKIGKPVEEMLETVRPHPSFCEAVTDVLGALEMQLGIGNKKKEQKKSLETDAGRKGGKLKFWR